MNNIKIGKYTLESLTAGMYINPLILFREYIQNSSDAIDEAINKGLISKEESYINIILDKINCEISIEDNGIGIGINEASKVLTDIGNSKKRFRKHKGFRGIGRLGGLSYCEELIFETSYKGENKKTILSINNIGLKEILIPGKYEDLGIEQVIDQITSIKYNNEEINKHYFKVILKGVNKKLDILSEEKVKKYIEETAPLPFNNSKFNFGDKINERLVKSDGVIEEYNIFIQNTNTKTKLYKPYRNKMYVDIKKKYIDEISDIKIESIKNYSNDKIVALVWYGKSNLKGTIVDNSIKGLRVRKSGILIGDRLLLNTIFKEERFNGWVVGEVIVLDEDIVPNSRRDDFEKNEEYLFLMEELRHIGRKISSQIRETSKNRNKKASEKKNKDDMSDIRSGVLKENQVQQKKDNIESKDIFKKLDGLVQAINNRNYYINKTKIILEENNVNVKIINKIIEKLQS